jgi:uncharacterized metal-binding protein YceD (DUF177 family)
MKPDRLIIQFGGLGVGAHLFEYQVKNKFFEQFDYSEIKKADINLTINFIKQNSVTTLNFTINGTVGIECDRCAGDYDLPVQTQETMYLKHGDESESNDNLIVLPFGESEVDLTKYVYEFITISLPIRRVPCEINKELYKCDEATLKKLNNFSVEEEPNSSQEGIWEELKKVKFKNN